MTATARPCGAWWGRSSSEQARREDTLTDAAHELLAVAERYPALRAADGFRLLHDQLVETEDRIAAARRLYNLEVRALNRRAEAFPSNLVASAFGFARADYFAAAEAGAAQWSAPDSGAGHSAGPGS